MRSQGIPSGWLMVSQGNSIWLINGESREFHVATDWRWYSHHHFCRTRLSRLGNLYWPHWYGIREAGRGRPHYPCCKWGQWVREQLPLHWHVSRISRNEPVCDMRRYELRKQKNLWYAGSSLPSVRSWAFFFSRRNISGAWSNWICVRQWRAPHLYQWKTIQCQVQSWHLRGGETTASYMYSSRI